MKAKEIRAFIKAFKQQRKLSLESFKSDMTEEQMHYFKEGMKAGYADCIFILEDEIGGHKYIKQKRHVETQLGMLMPILLASAK